MIWILQSNYVKESQTRPFAEAFNELGIPFVDVAVVPFSREFLHPLDPAIKAEDCIPYGSTSLMRIATERGWKHLFYDPVRFRVDVWNRERADMLNSDATIMTVAEAMHWAEGQPEMDEWFIRPIEDFKAFSGTLTVAKKIVEFTRNAESGSGNFSGAFAMKTLCAVSRPKVLDAEWRFFVVDGKVVTGSTYRWAGQKLTRRASPEETLIAQIMAQDWLPHRNVCMDVAKTAEGWKVVEFNCLNSSGIYYHDVKALVRAVTDTCR